VAGATGFEPVAFGFGVCARGVHNRPRSSPTLIESHGWRGGWIRRDHAPPIESQGFCYPVVTRPASGAAASHGSPGRYASRGLHGDRVPAVRSGPAAARSGAACNPHRTRRPRRLHPRGAQAALIRLRHWTSKNSSSETPAWRRIARAVPSSSALPFLMRTVMGQWPTLFRTSWLVPLARSTGQRRRTISSPGAPSERRRGSLSR
jgi:hypothetical protein